MIAQKRMLLNIILSFKLLNTSVVYFPFPFCPWEQPNNLARIQTVPVSRFTSPSLLLDTRLLQSIEDLRRATIRQWWRLGEGGKVQNRNHYLNMQTHGSLSLTFVHSYSEAGIGFICFIFCYSLIGKVKTVRIERGHTFGI